MALMLELALQGENNKHPSDPPPQHQHQHLLCYDCIAVKHADRIV